MKKLLLSSAITLLVGLVLVLVSAILNSINITTTDFVKSALTNPLLSIGYILTVVGGVIFTATSIASAIQSGETKKLKLASIISTGVGAAVILAVGVLRALGANINGANFNLNGLGGLVGLVPVINQLAYLFAILGAVVLIATVVANTARNGGELKKVIVVTGIIVASGIALILVAATLNALTITINNFVKSELTNVLNALGYLSAALSGVLLVGASVVSLTKGGEAKRLVVVTSILVAVGLALVLVSSVLASVSTAINSPDFTVTALTGVFNSIGYLVAILSGILLIAAGVSSAAKGEK